MFNQFIGLSDLQTRALVTNTIPANIGAHLFLHFNKHFGDIREIRELVTS